MTDPLYRPTVTDEVVTTVCDDLYVLAAVSELAKHVLRSAPSPLVSVLIDRSLLEQAILGAITRFVETAIDGQI